MYIFDALIIYFSCGLPFAVNYFLNNQAFADLRIWRRTLVILLFWPVEVALKIKRVFSDKFVSGHNSLDADDTDSRINAKIAELREHLESEAAKVMSRSSMFEYRTLLDRYVGLSLAISSGDGENRPAAAHLLEVSGHSNVDLGKICLSRRNRDRLFFHQTSARIDFVDAVGRLLQLNGDSANVLLSAIELARIVGDDEGVSEFEIFASVPEERQAEAISNAMEQDVWTRQRHKPAPVNQM